MVNLGALQARNGQVEEAAKFWRRALETNPAIEAAALNLSKILPPAEGIQVLERYLTFNPGSTVIRSRLDALRKAR